MLGGEVISAKKHPLLFLLKCQNSISPSEQRLSETVTPFLGKEKPLLRTSSKK